MNTWDDALDVRSPKHRARLVADCEACCFRGRLLQRLEAGAADGEYSQGETFWLPADATPRCSLEQIVRSVYMAHTSVAHGRSHASGAEFWSLVIDQEDADVGLHFDKDFGLEAERGINRTPAVATVTYLCDGGAPTLVIEKAPPPMLGAALDDGTPIRRSWLSHPAAGKHVAFDGSFLHGAPIELALPATKVARRGKRPKRVSLLVNVWLDHQPALAVPLPAELLSRLSPCLTQSPFRLETPSPTLTIPSVKGAVGAKRQRGGSGGGGGGGKDMGCERVACCWAVAQESEGECHLHLRLPLRKLTECAQGASLQIEFDQGDAALIETVAVAEEEAVGADV